jgi:hypothetical protein
MRRALLSLAACLGLAACGALPAGVAGGVAGVLNPQARAPAVALPADAPRLRLRLPGSDAAIGFARIAESRGVETWASAGGQSLSFRGGVLVATRGFGFDLMAAEADPVLLALSGAGPASYRRRMVYLDGVNRQVFLTFGCRIEAAEAGLREVCEGTRAAFANLYVMAPGGGILRSAQWAGPELGALAILPGSR